MSFVVSSRSRPASLLATIGLPLVAAPTAFAGEALVVDTPVMRGNCSYYAPAFSHDFTPRSGTLAVGGFWQSALFMNPAMLPGDTLASRVNCQAFVKVRIPRGFVVDAVLTRAEHDITVKDRGVRAGLSMRSTFGGSLFGSYENTATSLADKTGAQTLLAIAVANKAGDAQTVNSFCRPDRPEVLLNTVNIASSAQAPSPRERYTVTSMKVRSEFFVSPCPQP